MKRERFNKVICNIIVNGISSSYLFSQGMRLKIYKMLKYNINGMISAGVYLGSKNIKIASNAFINKKCYFDENATIEIEEGCYLGPEVILCTSTHKLGNSNMRAGELVKKDIKVKKGTWIGARVTILPGVTIGEGCIIGAGSVVTKDCNPNTLYVGVPAKAIKVLD